MKKVLMLFTVIAGCFLVYDLALAQELCSTPISTSYGLISGVMDKKEPVCVYKGIPFAEPPVGELRFKPPQPPKKWSGVFKADKFSPECIQPGGPMPGVKAEPRSEDCLYLNIWKPAKPKTEGPLPVMFWIHGGSLTTGSGIISLYWGDRLSAQKDVIVVTINYRLGALGFLAHKDLSAEDPRGSSGNYGLLDQIAALQWVRDNISGFGGDPNRVMIFGESAGGWSVCYLLASPLAQGLFQRAVIESGGCDTVNSMEVGFSDGEEFAKKVGCQGKTGKEMLSCLRSFPVEKMLEKEPPASEEKKKKDRGLFSKEDLKFVWVPHIDGWALKQSPIEALKSGNYNKVPLIVGSNRDEFKLFSVTTPGARLIPKSLIEKIMTDFLGREVTDGFKKLYPYKNYRRPADAALDAMGDIGLGCRCYWAVEALADKQPVYYYRFDYDEHLAPHMVGAAHAVEIPFVFGNLDRAPATIFLNKRLRKKAEPLKEAMMSYWTNFAKTGDPNGEGLVQWQQYDSVKRQRIYFDIPITLKETDNVEKCEFWSKNDPMKQ